MGRLEGRVAIVTGAASGVGLATAKLFTAEGATVVMADQNEEDLRQATDQGGKHLDSVVADTTRRGDLEALRDHVAATQGKVDVLFANAGVAAFALFSEVTKEAFDRVATTTFKDTFFTVQILPPVLRDGASIILTASVSGFKGAPAFSVYSAKKAAIRSLARTLTADLKDRGIRVNAVIPGNIETPISEHAGMSAEDTKQTIFWLDRRRDPAAQERSSGGYCSGGALLPLRR